MVAAESAIAGRSLRIMFQDEARFGRLPVMRSAWAPPGCRPVIKAAVEREYRYIYGAVSPLDGDLDWMAAADMNTSNMNAFLRQISEKYPRDYILMVADGASSHKGDKLRIPDNMAILKLPPYSPELNPVESVWDEVREKSCANTFFHTLDRVVDRVVAELDALARNASRVINMTMWPWIIDSI